MKYEIFWAGLIISQIWLASDKPKAMYNACFWLFFSLVALVVEYGK